MTEPEYIDRASRWNDDDQPFLCLHDDCRRLFWLSFVDPTDVPATLITTCKECERQTVLTKIAASTIPDDTVFIRDDGPVPVSAQYDVDAPKNPDPDPSKGDA